MSTSLGPLYHWSHRDRLNSIKRLGLVPGKPSLRMPEPDDDSEYVLDLRTWRSPYVCYATTPATAWSYALIRVPGIYDLWETYLTPTDEVHILPMWGERIIEVRVANRIPKSRLVWVGEREHQLRGVSRA